MQTPNIMGQLSQAGQASFLGLHNYPDTLVYLTATCRIAQSRCQRTSCKDNLENLRVLGLLEVAYLEPEASSTLMQNVNFFLCTGFHGGSCHLAALLQLGLELFCQAQLANPLKDGLWGSCWRRITAQDFGWREDRISLQTCEGPPVGTTPCSRLLFLLPGFDLNGSLTLFESDAVPSD